MPSEKRPKKATAPEAPPWQIILEETRSQNRATIEAVEAFRVALEQRIDRLDQESRGRDAVLEFAIRELQFAVQQNTVGIQQNSADIQQLKGAVQENTADIQELQGDVRTLSQRVEALARIEERVSAIEKRIA